MTYYIIQSMIEFESLRLAFRCCTKGGACLADADRTRAPHFVGEDAVQVVVVQRDHPLEADHLVLTQPRIAGRHQQPRLVHDRLARAVRNAAQQGTY